MIEVTPEEHKESVVFLWDILGDIPVNDDGEIEDWLKKVNE